MPAAAVIPILNALTPEDVIRDVKHLPSAPKVLPRLKRQLVDGNSAMHEIVALIRLDAGITARVLQVANSAYFNKGVRCFTVDEAVQRVGFNEVYQLVTRAASSPVLLRPLEVYGLGADALWMSSVTCALAADTLASRTAQDRQVAYTIGLLHNVGMVAIDEWALYNAPGLTLPHRGFPREATEGERAVLGFTQAEVGAALLQRWNFPAPVCEPLRWQYAPTACASQPRMAGLLLVAKWLRSAVCAGLGPAPAALDPAYLQALGLSSAELVEMVEDVERRLAAVTSMLDPTPEQRNGRAYFPIQDWS